MRGTDTVSHEKAHHGVASAARAALSRSAVVSISAKRVYASNTLL
jgi:hypothetical protein